MSDDDRELRELFGRLKAEERDHVPPFRTPTRRAQPARVPRVAVAAAVILIALVHARPDRPPRNVSLRMVDLGAAAWRSPTDFLLVTPGSELMRTVPAVGSPEHWGPIDLRDRSPAPESTRS
jgi:hypothetical protein